MAYLNTPRLTFSGKFQADPSTVNNDPNHFNNATFQSNFQDYQTAEDPNGWWNPDGTGNWRLVGCTVKSVTYKDGTSTNNPKEDPIIGMSITDANARVAAKIVDLDSQQQMVSEIWGMVVKIVGNDKDLMHGDYETAAFTNIWFNRSTDLKADAAAAATYQSIIKNITWDIDGVNSRYLKELKKNSPNQLSIQFTVDRYNGDHTSADFTMGRMVGSIGPSSPEEPVHAALGRQFFPEPKSNCNYAVAVVDEELKTLTLDMANSLQFGIEPSGEIGIIETRNLTVSLNKGTESDPDYVYLGKINYNAPGWYLEQAGICTFQLTNQTLDLVNRYPLLILDYQASQKNVFDLQASNQLVFQESSDYVVADQYVFRLNPGEKCTIDFYATQLGKRRPNATIVTALDTANLLQAPNNPILGVPSSILNFPASTTTDSNGRATIELGAGDPGNPRQFIDGQVYAIVYNLSTEYFANCNQSNFISLLVFDSVKESIIKNPTWADIQPTMQQYANLYPLMSKGVFNLADKEVVDNNAEILKFVFSKDLKDPNYMPATRDLSSDKSKMIINYLNQVLKQGKSKTIKREAISENNS